MLVLLNDRPSSMSIHGGNHPGLPVTLCAVRRLTYNPKTKALAVEPTANQDNPLSYGLGYSGNTPLLVSISGVIIRV